MNAYASVNLHLQIMCQACFHHSVGSIKASTATPRSGTSDGTARTQVRAANHPRCTPGKRTKAILCQVACVAGLAGALQCKSSGCRQATLPPPLHTKSDRICSCMVSCPWQPQAASKVICSGRYMLLLMTVPLLHLQGSRIL